MQRPVKRLLGVAAAALAAWAFFRAVAALRPSLDGAVRDANVPFGRVVSAVPRAAGALWEAATRGPSAVREAAALRAENERLAAEALGAEALREENDALRRELGLARAGHRLVAAQVVSEGGGAGWSGALRIDKGKSDGVEAGAPVIAPAGLVGRVVSATAHTADVLPLTDPNCRVSCSVDGFGASGHGIVAGGGLSRPDASLSLLHVVEPLDVSFLDAALEVAPGARVFTAGDGGAFPRGIPVGSVVSVGADASRLFQRAKVRPAVSFGSLRRVFVMARKEGAK